MRPSALLVFALLATAPALARHVLPAFSGPVRAVGDGAGVVRFELRWEGAAPQVEASAGEVTAVKPVGEGTWAVDFVPPRVAAPFEVVLAALLPCFWIYAEVGRDIHARAAPHNPYRAWIDTYAGEEFHAAVRAMIEATDEAAAGASPGLQARMHAAYTRAAQLEWMFWDSAYRLEQWSV